MRSVRCWAALLALTCLLLAVPAWAASPEKLQITVSIVPQIYFVKAIGGDLVDVAPMVVPGASPASYEPRPDQMAALAKSDIYFSIGVPFEKAWLKRFRDSAPATRFVPMHESIKRHAMQAHSHAHEGLHEEHHDHEQVHGHALPDPHIWLSPALVRIMAETVRDTLIQAAPEHAGEFHRGYERFCKELGQLDADLLGITAPARGSTFFVFHPSFGYFAGNYGLHQQAVEIGGKSPGPKDLARLVSMARDKGVKVIFVSPQFSTRSAETIAREINGSVKVANPLSKDWPDNLRRIAKVFAEAAAK